MTACIPVPGPGEPTRTSRSAAALLIAGWVLTVAASYAGEPNHRVALALVNAFLPWRVWRGGCWSRHFLIGLSVVSAILAAGATVAIMFGAIGIVVLTVAGLWLYAAVGALLCAPPITRHVQIRV